MSSNFDKVYNLIGQIKVTDIKDMEDGTCKVTFDYDKKFKDEYKRLFNLKRFTKKHFEQQLQVAIEHFAEQVRKDKLCFDTEGGSNG